MALGGQSPNRQPACVSETTTRLRTSARFLILGWRAVLSLGWRNVPLLQPRFIVFGQRPAMHRRFGRPQRTVRVLGIGALVTVRTHVRQFARVHVCAVRTAPTVDRPSHTWFTVTTTNLWATATA